jgi:hypothetical protein
MASGGPRLPRCANVADDELRVHAFTEWQVTKAQRVERARVGRESVAKRRDRQPTRSPNDEPFTDVDVDVDKKPASRKRDGVTDADEHWQAFWSSYPRKVGEGAARNAWAKAVAAAGDHAVVIAGATAYAAAVNGSDPQFIAHPSSWLNAEPWADELPRAQLVDDGPRSSVFTTPAAPPPDVADDPALYKQWMADQKRRDGAA